MNNKNQLSTAAADGLQLGSGLRRIVCLAALLALSIVGARADVDIYDEQIFPDANFRDWLLEQDYGYDGYISDDELMWVEYMDVSSRSIASLKGIEFFTALTELDCYGNQLTELDVSNNTALTTLNCGGNPLTELDVSKNTELTYLYCYITQVSALDLSNNTKLISLSCDRNKLSALDLSNNKLLNTVACYGNQIRGAAMTALVNSLPETGGILYVYDNSGTEGNIMTTAQVAAATAKNWTPMMRDDNWVEYPGVPIAIDETNFPDAIFKSWVSSNCDTDKDGILSIEEIAAVTKIELLYKGITSLEGIEYFTALKQLDCYRNALTSLDVSGCTALTRLNCSDNQLTSLDLSKNTALTYLACYNNQLTVLNVSKNTALKWLYCYYNQLTSFDVSKNAALTELQCYDNQLTELDVSKNTALIQLCCYSNQLTSLDVSGCTDLTRLECHYNQLTSLNVSGCAALTYLACYNNQLTVLNVSKNTALKWLYCYYNQLTSLDVSNNTALETLRCHNNQLTSLDVSGCTALTQLSCAVNQLTYLDVSKNTALTQLDCSANQLTSLGVSKNTALRVLYCYGNLIRGAAMTTLVNNLPDWNSASEVGYLLVYQDESPAGNLMTPGQVEVATSKNWSVINVGGGTGWDWVPYEGETVPGDANGDGEVNALDVDCLRDYILGLDPQPFSFESANMNGDDVVDIQDLTQLIQLLTE